MTADTLVVFGILAVTIVLFVSERLRLDLVALMSLLALSVTGILTPAESFAGFSDPVVIMIAGLFVVAGAMFRTGLAERFGQLLGRLAGTGRARATAVVMLGTGALSGFMSTTGTVALMLPVTSSLARNARLSPSLLLIPLAVGALLGGLLTLIATPPNIIVANQLAAAGYEPFGFFDFTPIGVVLLAAGTAVLVAFGGQLLPSRAPVDKPVGTDAVTVPGAELTHGYSVGPATRLRVTADSALPGLSPAEAGLRRQFHVNIVAIRRAQGRAGRMERVPRTAEEPLRAGDEIDVHGTPEAITRLRTEQRLELIGEGESDAMLAEVLLTPRSRLIGHTLAQARFRSRYRVNVLSVRRHGKPVDGDLADIPLRFADTLLVAGSAKGIDLLRDDSREFVVVARAHDTRERGAFSRHEIAALLILLGMLVLLTFEIVPAATAVLTAAVAMVLARCLDMTAAYREINWESVILIAAILPMATALQKTGGVDLIVAQLAAVSRAGPFALLTAIYVLTGLMGMFISNTATAALIAPVALAAAVQLGISPYPVLMTVAVASSTAFSTPVSSPVNMLVLGPGDYRFRDFVRVGVPLQVLLGIITVILMPWLFPF